MLISSIKKSQLYFISSFLFLIFVGTLLLKMPFVIRLGEQLSWVDALFTSTSAVCVTGLTVVDFYKFSFPGQIIVMLLIQLGGIGIMTMSASIIFFLGKNISWSENKLISNMTENYSQIGLEHMIKGITIYTLLVETFGMGLLLIGFLLNDFDIYDSLWYALFHSISAFCNAGFSPLSNNLIGLSSYIKIVIAFLIVLGGLGMYAIHDISMAIHKLSTKDSKMTLGKSFRCLRITTKLILITSLILIVLGGFAIKFFQYKAGLNISYIDAFFQSVSARTAGFNSIDMTTLSSSSVSVLIFLMLIGGAPGSTAGGMKVTTFALVCMALYSTFSGKQKILLFKKEIPMTNILKSFTVAITFIFLAFIGAAIFQAETNTLMQSALFEISSALGTVGLTLGATAENTFDSKLFVSFYMFLGRIGPLTLFLFLMEKEKKSHLIYPEEKVIIG